MKPTYTFRVFVAEAAAGVSPEGGGTALYGEGPVGGAAEYFWAAGGRSNGGP